MEMRNYINTYSSMLKFSFLLWKFKFLGETCFFFTISENKIKKIQNFTEMLIYRLESSIQNFRAIYP